MYQSVRCMRIQSHWLILCTKLQPHAEIFATLQSVKQLRTLFPLIALMFVRLELTISDPHSFPQVEHKLRR